MTLVEVVLKNSFTSFYCYRILLLLSSLIYPLTLSISLRVCFKFFFSIFRNFKPPSLFSITGGFLFCPGRRLILADSSLSIERRVILLHGLSTLLSDDMLFLNDPYWVESPWLSLDRLPEAFLCLVSLLWIWLADCAFSPWVGNLPDVNLAPP